MLSKIHKNKLSQRFSWTVDEVDNAIQEVENTMSIVNLEEILDLCIKTQNPKKRWESLVRCLNNNLSGELSRTISNLLFIEPCFKIIAIFNLHDSNSTLKKKTVGLEFSKKKSFLNWKPYVVFSKVKSRKYYLNIPKNIDLIDSQSDGNVPLHQNPNIFPELLSHAYIETLIETNNKSQSNFDLIKLFKEVVQQVGFLAFSIKDFMNIVIETSYKPNLGMNEDILKDISLAISHKYLRHQDITEREHWLMYSLAEILKRKGNGTRESFRKAGAMLIIPPNSVHRRYYEKQKEANNKGYSLEEIIFKYHLRIELNELFENA